MSTLKGKRAVVCGSTQGIGRACAIELARLGASITLMARHPEGLQRVQGELDKSHGQSHDSIQVDFSDWQSVRQKASGYVGARGPVHILVNNTGGPPAGPVFEAQPEDFLKAMSQHVLCNQVLAQAVAPGMRDAKYGRIINIISTSVMMPIKGLGVSNTIRAAVANWARTLAVELAPFGITVNNVLPGYTATARLESLIKGRATRAGTTPDEVQREMIASVPARRFGTPEEIAAVAGFLASPAAGYVNGVNFPVDGGRLAAQ
ncbi:MAG: SDR family oxidoreductase [Phycisphaerales bacterium]|nr:SDR family oxidoreductase [Phycisphaerales bacterium]MCI0631424.1 SDR family oxidoreductase [Phycisphaerales bacterium]MCI0676966.1 SDR family oxidoreductase [Phycisphaerales bacterium]